MKWSESITAIKRLPTQVNAIGNLIAATLTIAVIAIVFAAMALMGGGVRNAA